MKKWLAYVLLCIPCAAFAKLPVVASFSILGDVVSQVGGEHVQVVTLVGPNQDAHVYQPSPKDVKAVAHAKVFIVSGLGFEGWMNRLSKAAGFKGELIVASQGIRALQDHSHEQHGHAGVDPHVWHNPRNVMVWVKNIEAGLIKADPSHAKYYETRANEYMAKLNQLDKWANAEFLTIPVTKRKVLTSHDAFAYMGQRYRIQFMSPQGVSTESEASALSVAKLLRQIKSEHVKAVFIENLSDQRLLKQLSKEAGIQVEGKLYSDALSSNSEPAHTYIGFYESNVKMLLKGMRQ